jgi:hypothetical protein
MDTIDERFPGLDDSLSLPELWTRYRLNGRTSEFAILKRRESPLTYSTSSPVISTVASGDRVAIPGFRDNAVWASIKFQPSVLGRLLLFFFKLRHPDIFVETADGLRKKYRLPARMASTGFLLSPVIDSARKFESFASQNWRNALACDVVTAVTIVNNDPASFEPDITVTLARFEMGRD